MGQLCKGGFGRCNGCSLLLSGDLVTVGTFLSVTVAAGQDCASKPAVVAFSAAHLVPS